jgi:hypothetical protein
MNWRDLALTSLINPREAARVLINSGLRPGFGWALFALGTVLSGLLGHLATGLILTPPGATPIDISPFALTGLQALSQGIVVLAAHALGRAAGGRARFDQVLILMAWVEILLVGIHALDLAFLLVLPPLAGILPLFGVIAALWVMANFLTKAHGFASPLPVLGAIIGASMLFGVVLLTLLDRLGIQIGAFNV